MTHKSPLLALVLVVLALAPCSAHAACKLNRFAELPVTMEGLRPIVTGKINGEDVRFIADSGAFFSTISKMSAQHFHLKLSPTPYGLRISGFGGVADMQMTTTHSFSFLGYTFPSMDFIVGADNVFNSEYNIIGLLGDNILTSNDVEFDLAKGAMRLFDSRDCGNALLAYWAKPTDATSEMRIETGQRFHLIGEAKVNVKRMRVLFDTGTPLSFLGLRAAARAGLTPDGPGVAPAGATGGIGDRVFRSWVTPVSELEIGTETIKTTRMRIADAEMDDEDLVLGADFFLSHHVYASRKLGRLYFTYNGGPVFDLRTNPQAPVSPATPPMQDIAATKTGEDADRLGQAAMSTRAFATAKAYFDRAIALEPTSALYLVHRAGSERALEAPDQVKSDLDQAIKLQPDLELARLQRAVFYLHIHDVDDAHADFDAAVAAHPSETRLPLSVAAAYSGADAFGLAIDTLDAWIAAHPHDDGLASALNSRCWARAQWNHDLDRALADCNQSLRLQRDAQTFDSRGLVHLRLGQIDGAISDYNTALRLRPQTPWSLFGRSLAEKAKGQTDASEADMKLATQLAPNLPARAASLGIVPPSPAAATPTH